jgi:acylglycerol lipase
MGRREPDPTRRRALLVLYGERDEIVPKPSIQRMLKTGPRHGRWRIAVYDTGCHLLLRGLEGPRRWRDIAAWIDNPARGLPSGADRRAATVLGGGP